MRTLQAIDQEAGGTHIQLPSGGSWWVPDIPTDNQALAATVSTTTPVRNLYICWAGHQLALTPVTPFRSMLDPFEAIRCSPKAR